MTQISTIKYESGILPRSSTKCILNDGIECLVEFDDGQTFTGSTTTCDGIVSVGRINLTNLYLINGIRTYKNGCVHTGLFENNLLVKGTKSIPNGTTYEGIFVNSILTKGKKIYQDGATKEGTFVDNYLIEGVAIEKNGVIRDGKFIKDKLINGSITYSHKVCEGVFCDDYLIEGKMTYKNGTVYKGKFSNGYIIKGEIIKSNGKSYVGTFSDGLLIKGRISFPDGNSHEGTFVNRTLIDGVIMCKNYTSYRKMESVTAPDNTVSANYTSYTHRHCTPLHNDDTHVVKRKLDNNSTSDNFISLNAINNNNKYKKSKKQ